jgi:hypothetical protein
VTLGFDLCNLIDACAIESFSLSDGREELNENLILVNLKDMKKVGIFMGFD